MSALAVHIGLLLTSAEEVLSNRIEVTHTVFPTASTSHPSDFHTTVFSGDLLVAQFVYNRVGSGTASAPAGWTYLCGDVQAATVGQSWWWKIADGSEAGTTVDFTTTTSVQAVTSIHRIEAGTYTPGMIAGWSYPEPGGSGGTAINPTPPAIPVPWGLSTNLGIAAFASRFGMTGTTVTYPSGAIGGDHRSSAPSNITSAVVSQAAALLPGVYDQLAPGDFTKASSSDLVNTTIAIAGYGVPLLLPPVLVTPPVAAAWTVDATSHSQTLPSGIAAGERLLLLVGIQDTVAQTPPVGWTTIASYTYGPGGNSSVSATVSVYMLDAAGTEGGTSVNVVTATAQRGGSFLIRLAPGTFDPTVLPEINTPVTVATTDPSPGSASPSWGVADTLFMPFTVIGGRRPLVATELHIPGYAYALQANSGSTTSQDVNPVMTYNVYRSATSWPAAFRISSAQTCSSIIVMVKPAP